MITGIDYGVRGASTSRLLAIFGKSELGERVPPGACKFPPRQPPQIHRWISPTAATSGVTSI